MTQRICFWVGAALTALTGLFNPGIISLDDYNNGFSVMVPAQNAPSVASLAEGIFPFFPKLVLRTIAQTAYAIGISEPFSQLRFSLAVLGLAVFLILFTTARLLFAGREKEWRVAAFLVAFYFALPLFSSRPMNETLCMPWLTLSGLCAALYAQSGLRKWLLAALATLTLACLMRFQAGVCGLALLFLVLYRRNSRDFLFFALAGASLFLLSGLPDYFQHGRLHAQLRDYLAYNVAFSGDHFGRMPFYTFFFLALGLSLPPTFFSRYRGFDWRRAYQPLTGPLLYVILFLLSHSLSPHKEDRFFIPILPLFLFTLVPMATHLWNHGAAWRRYWFLGMNGALLILSCTNVAQNNVLGLARWVANTPAITAVDSLDQSLIFYPQAFIARPVHWGNDQSWRNYQNRDCQRIAVLRSDIATDDRWKQAFREAGAFRPGWIEQLLVKANSKNARRGPLVAYLPAHCVP